jgi:hypothetical protein
VRAAVNDGGSQVYPPPASSSSPTPAQFNIESQIHGRLNQRFFWPCAIPDGPDPYGS